MHDILENEYPEAKQEYMAIAYAGFEVENTVPLQVAFVEKMHKTYGRKAEVRADIHRLLEHALKDRLYFLQYGRTRRGVE